MADAYAVLGLSQSASAVEIKSAYRRLAKKFHPDLNRDNPKAADSFRLVSAAYECLTKGTPMPEAAQPRQTRSQAKPKSIRRVDMVLTASLSQAFTGTRVNVMGQQLSIEPGFHPHVQWTYTLRGINEGAQVRFDFAFKDHPGFTVDGSDLYTKMRVHRSVIRKGETIAVPNHPNPLGQNIRFPATLKKRNTSVTLAGAGIPGADRRPAGKLVVEVELYGGWRDQVSDSLKAAKNLYYQAFWVFVLYMIADSIIR